ncbi:Uncharacterized protein APZ42_005168 [Daphnia magna]|uniref:Uncharacterized protein n=1 Tax=Daphnia magna TaxID=35525 RepID=A0A164GLX1_9CRUS|nr:Uncharacterized protein APZ42_005168 [Daphnia magna]
MYRQQSSFFPLFSYLRNKIKRKQEIKLNHEQGDKIPGISPNVSRVCS